MADDDKAARDAQRTEIKALVKEAIAEYVTEAEKTRTDAKKKDNGGLFGALFGA